MPEDASILSQKYTELKELYGQRNKNMTSFYGEFCDKLAEKDPHNGQNLLMYTVQQKDDFAKEFMGKFNELEVLLNYRERGQLDDLLSERDNDGRGIKDYQAKNQNNSENSVDKLSRVDPKNIPNESGVFAKVASYFGAKKDKDQNRGRL